MKGNIVSGKLSLCSKDLQDFTQNFICLDVLLSWKNPLGRERESSCVAEDITKEGFGKQRASSNCNTKRHCSRSSKVSVELKEVFTAKLKCCVKLNFYSHNYVPLSCSDLVA